MSKYPIHTQSNFKITLTKEFKFYLNIVTLYLGVNFVVFHLKYTVFKTLHLLASNLFVNDISIRRFYQ